MTADPPRPPPRIPPPPLPCPRYAPYNQRQAESARVFCDTCGVPLRLHHAAHVFTVRPG